MRYTTFLNLIWIFKDKVYKFKYSHLYLEDRICAILFHVCKFKFLYTYKCLLQRKIQIIWVLAHYLYKFVLLYRLYAAFYLKFNEISPLSDLFKS